VLRSGLWVAALPGSCRWSLLRFRSRSAVLLLLSSQFRSSSATASSCFPSAAKLVTIAQRALLALRASGCKARARFGLHLWPNHHRHA
jgi:hypothetical protein